MYIKPEQTINQLPRRMAQQRKHALANLNWLRENMHPYLFVTLGTEKESLPNLCMNLQTLGENHQLVLRDADEKFIIATLNKPGTLFRTLNTIRGKKIIYAEMIHSDACLPGQEYELEIQKFHFRTEKEEQESTSFFRGKGRVRKALQEHYPSFNFREFDTIFHYFLKNNRQYVLLSPARRVARGMWLYQSAIRQGGAFLDIEPLLDEKGREQSRLTFSVIDPLAEGYIGEVIEIFYRLNIATRRNYVVEIEDPEKRVTILTAYIATRDGKSITKNMPIFSSLESELYNTKVINPRDRTYQDLVTGDILTGPEGSLLSAICTFVHTNMAHSSPYRFDWSETQDAFFSHLQLTRELLQLFDGKFNPDQQERMERDALEQEYQRVYSLIEEYNTGHALLDETRKIMFSVALLFVRYTLKTNFFVTYKRALSFRLDRLYMEHLPREIRANLPPDLPFRTTFFYHRHGSGYHFGFSDIARGGFRTIITRSKDDFESAMNTIFKEAMVLAHTQHLKNKDIYQGGSKLAVVMRAFDLKEQARVTNRLYDLQRGMIDAFLDIFVTRDGKPIDPKVVDYYGEDEPIELGPDENIHNSMIEEMAERAKERGYILGGGIISSKKIGINHKEYGVTSLGVLKYVERTLKELGIDARTDLFTVKLTGGTNGDVAGNLIKLVVGHCPEAQITSITDASGVMYDPKGIHKRELSSLVHKDDIAAFSTDLLNEGGFILYSREQRKEGLVDLFKKVTRTNQGIKEEWVSADEFHAQFENHIFSHFTDVFVPCGGRPETIHTGNWERLFDKHGCPTTRVIVEGANSFISPEARENIQKRGIIIIKDSSANKCGVICSSYEIIGGLLMTDREFLQNKEVYVKDVLKILEKRAADESELILQRHNLSEDEKLYTDISNEISYEINELTDTIYEYLMAHPEKLDSPPFVKALLVHFPAFVQKRRKFRARIKGLPMKYRAAMVSSEIATQSVYHGGFEAPFEEKLDHFVRKVSRGLTA
ncbi:MAG TPA: NAD-glutamate dehydrogenase domain-containing protein [Desulfatiglandales bacterium]|nr:NAD-glutamate dehydrogenase domain-containing protein [Desulfatiglandales bacterium]